MGLPSIHIRLPRRPRQGPSTSTEIECSCGHPRRFWPAGGSAAPFCAIVFHNRNVTTPTMDRRGDARTAELNHLQMALAAIALQLAAFETRLQVTSLVIR